jgi:ribonuclease Z
MFEVVFLGTAASVPTPERGMPALLVTHGQKRYLIDCGEGTQRQLLVSGIGYRHVDTVLLTHGHLDHVLGLGGLAATFSEWGAAELLTIYGGADALREARRFLEGVVMPEAGRLLDLDFRPLAPGVVIEDEAIRISAFRVEHRNTESYGFLFDDKPQRHFDAGKAKALGIPRGPDRQRLINGEDITLADGSGVAPDDVLGPPTRGARLAVVGDVADAGALVDAVRGADALVIEATYAEADRDRARAYGHITAKEAAGLARDAGVGALWLTHVSARYRGPELEAEARTVFANTRIAADFERMRVMHARAGGLPAEPPAG